MGLEAAQDNPAFQEISAAVEAGSDIPKAARERHGIHS
jgi:hypothetical protein